MNIGLGLLVEVVAFLAAAYVVVEMRPRLPQQTTDLVLGSIGCAMGAGALLFQEDVSLVGGVLAPLLAAVLLVATRASAGRRRRQDPRVGANPHVGAPTGVRYRPSRDPDDRGACAATTFGD